MKVAMILLSISMICVATAQLILIRRQWKRLKLESQLLREQLQQERITERSEDLSIR